MSVQLLWMQYIRKRNLFIISHIIRHPLKVMHVNCDGVVQSLFQGWALTFVARHSLNKRLLFTLICSTLLSRICTLTPLSCVHLLAGSYYVQSCHLTFATRLSFVSFDKWQPVTMTAIVSIGWDKAVLTGVIPGSWEHGDTATNKNPLGQETQADRLSQRM